MEDKKWLSFEKTGRVTDYLTYCQSSIGKYAEYETGKTWKYIWGRRTF